MEKRLTISFETAIEGGSVSLLEGEKEIDFWIGDGQNSKADDILEKIQSLLLKNKIKRNDIELITVSSGPGSFTGVRNGIATALGLKKALNCGFIGVSVFDSMILRAQGSGYVLTAIPIGRGQVGCQIYEVPNQEEHKIVEKFEVLNKDQFFNDLKVKNYDSLILHPKLYESTMFQNEISDKNNFINSGKNLALLIGILGRRMNSLVVASDNV